MSNESSDNKNKLFTKSSNFCADESSVFNEEFINSPRPSAYSLSLLGLDPSYNDFVTALCLELFEK